MRNIIVAGAGHGGLAAAYNLAKDGYSVTVFEKSKKVELGHDWHDVIDLSVFDYCGMPCPRDYLPLLPTAVYMPKKRGLLVLPKSPNKDLVFIDRRYLDAFLVEQCEAVGVKFEFGRSCIAPLIEGDKVVGVKTSFVASDGAMERQVERRIEDVYADLVIDAAGMYSSIKANLPDTFGIKKSFALDEILYTYRAYYEKTYKKSKEPFSNSVYLNHAKLTGMSRVIKRGDSLDCYVGSMKPFNEYELRDAMEGFKRYQGDIGTRLHRGGFRGNIPVAPVSPCLLAPGYAMVGDTASMTEAITARGMSLSMRAGKLLSDAIKSAGTALFDIESLWSYQYNCFKDFGLKQAAYRVIKNPAKLPTYINVIKLLPKSYSATAFKKWEAEYKKLGSI